MKRVMALGCLALLAAVLSVGGASAPANAATSCVFVPGVLGTSIVLANDCVTDEPILVPDGYTLDGNGHSITAVEPAVGHFTGAIVTNAGDEMHVANLTLRAQIPGNRATLVRRACAGSSSSERVAPPRTTGYSTSRRRTPSAARKATASRRATSRTSRCRHRRARP